MGILIIKVNETEEISMTQEEFDIECELMWEAYEN
jgi:hypothetical protein